MSSSKDETSKDDGADKAAKIVEGFKQRLGANRNALLAHASCVHCGMCADSCHYFLSTGDPRMTPAYKADQVRKLYKRHVDWLGQVAPFWVGGKTLRNNEDIEKLKDIVFGSCSLCRRCTVNCPFGIDKALIMRMARGLLTGQGVAPEGIRTVMKDQWEVGNQMGITSQDYLETIDWLQDELRSEVGDPEATIPIDKQGANIVFIVNPREIKYAPQSLIAAAKIFHVAGESWTLPSVGWDNTNFGLFSGDDKLGGHMGKLAFDQAIKLGVKRMVISECGHGYRSTKWESPNWAAMDLPFPIDSFLEVMCEYLNQGKIELDPSKNPEPVTYHDPCNLSRSSGITEEPRFLLKAACMDYREMTPNRQDSFCCTGGGGAMSMAEYSKRRVSSGKVKADQIKETGATQVATACHNCVDGLGDVIKHYGMKMPVKNVCEFVADAIVLPAGMAKARAAVSASIKGKKILVCDDSPDIVEFLTTLLKDEGFETSSARDGDECLRKAAAEKPDLITLDVTMPGKSGVAVFTELRRDPATASIPVFIISGVMDFRSVIYHREVEPPEGYMEKPVDREVMLRTVRRILDLARSDEKKAN